MLSLAVPLFIISVLIAKLIYSFLLPPTEPKNIPAIPFYVSLIPFIWDVDQSDIYRKYLEKPLHSHGAVKIFFGSRWNILVTRPAYIAEVLKDEDVYKKTGNQVKIPYSVLADYTGDNIISSHGHNWRLYKGIIQPGLQKTFETSPIQLNARKLCTMISGQQSKAAGTGITVPLLLHRYALANLAESVLQTESKTLDDPTAFMHTLQLAVKREIFKPMFLNFPMLDKLPIPSRMRARQLVKRFGNLLTEAILKSHEHEVCSMDTDKLGCRLVASRRTGLITDQQFRHNCISVFLAGHENPQLLMTSMLYLLGKHQDAQTRLRAEIATLDNQELTSEAITNLPYLTSIIYETLRLFPPISQLINRSTSVPVTLGPDIAIPCGTYVGYNAYATNRDPIAWGSTANDFKPERWGATVEEIAKTYRRASAKSEIISFHGGRRACLGERFAMLEARITIIEILKKFRFEIDPSWEDKMTAAGPLYPRALSVRFYDLEKSG